jgi:dTDP-4-dehydrorhamnose reductase
MSQPVILVTGANGQLGKELQVLHAHYPQFRFVFASREDLKLHHFGLVENYFIGLQPDYCINCAAYTAVDKAESEPDVAMLVNGEAVGHLAAVCKKFGTRLIHISTDYVFDGESETPHREEDPTGPVSVYGRSKLWGEELCRKENHEAIIIRTAWVYSEFGHNFVKTMMRLMKERAELNVVNDQVGAPTYARDLAEAIMQILVSGKWEPGTYHYSNKGKISWYDFATEIKRLTASGCVVQPIPTAAYPTPARRPHFSLLDTGKISKTYGVSIPEWQESLAKCIEQLRQHA